MEHNPYSPPSAAVADPRVAPPIERPLSVTWAIRLVWLTFAIGVPVAFYVIAKAEPAATVKLVPLTLLAIFEAVGFGVCFWLLDALGKGKNWARIVLLGLFLLNVTASFAVPAMMHSIGQSTPDPSILEWVVGLSQDGLMIAAFVCMFSPSARPWFQHRD